MLEFKDSNDYLFCDAPPCGDVACFGLQVSNVGAACFSNQTRSEKTFMYLQVALATGGCTNDVCCRGFEACGYANFGGAHSLSGDGKEACTDAVVDNGLDGFDSLVGTNINFNGGQTSMIAVFCGSRKDSEIF